MQEPDSFPEGRAAVCPVCTSAARKIKVALARARDGVHQEGLVSALRGTRSACFWGVTGCPHWDGEFPRQGRSFLPVLAGSWGRELAFPVLIFQMFRALEG